MKPSGAFLARIPSLRPLKERASGGSASEYSNLSERAARETIERLRQARCFAARPIKRAVISASALSLLCPESGVPGYSREQFVNHLIDEAVEASRVLEAVDWIPVDQLGTTDDSGFAPFDDDTSTSRETAFAKTRTWLEGNARISRRLFGSDL